MRVLKIHLVYGEDNDESMPTPLCEPLVSTWFSVSIPDGYLIDAAELTVAEFNDQLAQIVEVVQEMQESDLPGGD